MSIQENKKVRWEEMFPDELYQKIQDEPVCYLAYGLAELKFPCLSGQGVKQISIVQNYLDFDSPSMNAI